MRSALSAAILALAVLAGTAAPAAAASSATTIHLPKGTPGLAGPVFAGDAVAFGRVVDGAYEVVVRRDADATISRIPLPGLRKAAKRFVSAQLEASDRRLVLALGVSVCGRDNCSAPGATRLLYSAALTGNLSGGKLTRLAGCTSEARCSGNTDCLSTPEVDVSGDVVAFKGCLLGVHVRDLSPGASPSARDYPRPAYLPRVADPFVAYYSAGAENALVVANWRTGLTAYSVSAEDFEQHDVQSDGKLIYQPTYRQLGWASPSEPFAHIVREDLGYPLSVRVAGDRLGYEYQQYPEQPDVPGSDVIEEHNLDPSPPPGDEDPGILARYEDTRAVSSIDFDGSRFTWITRVCRRSWLNVWDLADQRPAPVQVVACPIPRIVPGSARVDAKKRFRITLECPAEPAVGCPGFVTPGNTGVDVHYSIPAGERATKRLSAGGLCRGTDGRVSTKIYFARARGYGVAVRTVTVHGATAQLPRC